VKRELDDSLRKSRVERATAERSLQLAQRREALAAEGLRLTQRAFELGESDLFTLLQARAQALASQRELRLRRLELERATARYNQAMGVIPE
jgi:outer membrane protein TolC